MAEKPPQFHVTGTDSDAGARPENAPDMTAEEVAFFARRPGGDRATDVGGDDNGTPTHGKTLAEQIAASGDWGAEGEGEAGGPQRGEEGAAAAAAADPASPAAGDLAEEEEAPAPAWDANAWAATADDFDSETRLAEIPEQHRPVATRFAQLARERVARAEEGVAARVDALGAAANARLDGVVGKLEELRDKALAPHLARLENAGVLDAQKVIDEITEGINKAADREAEIQDLQLRLYTEQWRGFVRDEPEAQLLINAAKRGDKAAVAAYETFKRGASLSLRDGWDLVKSRHGDVLSRIRPVPAQPVKAPEPVKPATPPAPPAPTVARQPVAPPAPPPSRMEPRSATIPAARTRPAAPPPQMSLDDELSAAWAEYKNGRAY